MESQPETWGRWKVCNGEVLAAIMATKVRWVFRGEDCTSLLERRTELKGWEAGIMLTFPKGHTLGMVNTQGSVWGLVMFISDTDGGWDEPVQQYMLGTDDWLPARRTWGLWWISSRKWSQNVLSLPIGWTTYWATLGGTEQSSQGRLLYPPLTWCWWGCTWNRLSYFWSPPISKMLGNWRGFPWRTTKMFQDLEQIFWDLWGDVEETGLFFV